MSISWNSKKECRSFYKNLCAERFAQGLVQNQEQLNRHLLNYFGTQQGTWAGYQALSTEASITTATQVPKVNWVFPRIAGDNLEFCRAHNFSLGSFGVLEPAQDSEVISLDEVQGMLIPGLVFNKNGNRLGKGKGFYDRALSNFRGKKVGVCFEFQISEKLIPTEAHDIRMDYLLTDQGLWDCRMQK